MNALALLRIRFWTVFTSGVGYRSCIRRDFSQNRAQPPPRALGEQGCFLPPDVNIIFGDTCLVQNSAFFKN